MRKLILDFDGIVASTRKHTIAFRKALIYGLSEKTGLSMHKVEKDLVYGKRKVLEKPYDYGGVINGYKAIFADEQAYDWYGNATKVLYETKPEYKFAPQDDFDKFLEETFANSAGKIDSYINKKVAKDLEKIISKADVAIVSDGSNGRIERALNEAVLNIEVVGKAKKVIIDPTFDKVDRYLDVDGLKVEIRRPHYFEILKDFNVDMVVGDVFSMDLALPYHLGIDIVLKENYYTPKWSKDFVTSNGKVIRDLRELLEII